MHDITHSADHFGTAEALIRLRDDSSARVYKLTRAAAARFGIELAHIHNFIPFQHWTEAEVSTDEIDGRRFFGKWELSHFATIGDEIAAVNFAYERPAESRPYSEDSIYLHRFAVLPKYQNLWLGRLFHSHIVDNAFKYEPRILLSRNVPLYGQTQASLENAHIIRFYTEGGGARPVAFVYYPHKLDVVTKLTEPDFRDSPHWLELLPRRTVLR